MGTYKDLTPKEEQAIYTDNTTNKQRTNKQINKKIGETEK